MEKLDGNLKDTRCFEQILGVRNAAVIFALLCPLFCQFSWLEGMRNRQTRKSIPCISRLSKSDGFRSKDFPVFEQRTIDL